MSLKISVILAVYNGEAFLDKAIKSVLTQTYSNFELIIVDDASTDTTPEIIARFENLPSKKHSIQSICLKKNSGQGEAFNQGISLASGSIVSFLDADDYWFEDKLETVASAFDKYPGTVLHQHHLQLLKDGTLTSNHFSPILSVGDLNAYARINQVIPAFSPTSALSIKKEILDIVCPIPGSFRICADGFLSRTTMCYGRVAATDKALGAYRVHSNNNTFENQNFDSAKYIRELLIPELNQFYQKCGISTRFTPRIDFETATIEDLQTSLNSLHLKSNDRVVVVRSAPANRISPILQTLHNIISEVDLVVQNGMQFIFENPKTHLHLIEPGPIDLDSLPDKLIEQLHQINPRCIIIPYLENDADAYYNIHKTFSSLGLNCDIFGLSPFGDIHPTNPSRYPSKEHSIVSARNKNDDSLNKIRNQFEGRRAFLIGNGPSLKIEDLDLLKNEICFASNKIFLAYQYTTWRPTVYSCCDEVVARNNRAKMASLDHIKVYANSVRKYLWNDPYAMFANPEGGNAKLPPETGWDLIWGAHAGHSILNFSIKVAYWMGIREIYIIGADYHFKVPQTPTGETIMNNKVIVSKGEQNHFHPDYRPYGETWTLPKFKEMESDFLKSKTIFETSGGKIFNASRFSKLNVFDRVDFDSLFQNENR